jgi:hypothetical protein
MVYNVIITLSLLDGHTVADAKLDGDEALGDYELTVEADSPDQAEERALTRFNEVVAIGMPEFVDATARIVDYDES